METAFDEVHATMKKHRCSMRIAAFILAIQRVAETSELRGLYA
jgi:glutamate dehydrogenase/leucine dehydrogenase